MKNHSRTLLLVEDEAPIAMNEKLQLEKVGYSVAHVLTGEAAVTHALDSESRPDLILMDINLGSGIDGTQAAEQILNEMEIPIVFLSSHTEPEVVEKTEKITSYGYVVKNSGLTILDASIKMAFKLFESKMQEQQHKADLLHSRDLMRYVIEHTRGAVAVHDRDLKYLYVSKQYLDQFNVKERDVIGKHHYEVFPDLPQKFRDAHQRALRGEVSSGEDDPYQRDDGTIAWTRWECRPWYETDNSIGGFIVYTEVLSQEFAERLAIRHTMNYVQSILQTTRDGFAVVDMDGHYLDVNDAACEMCGYSREEFLQLSIWDIVVEEDPNSITEWTEQIRSTGSAVFEARNQRKDGTVFDTEVSASFLGGEQDRIIAFHRDITERKQADERLRQVLNEYNTVFNGTQDALFLVEVIDEDTYRYVRNNRSHAEATGFTTEQIENKSPQELLGKELGDELAGNYRRCYQAGHPISYEETLDLPGGKRMWFTTLTPIFDQGEIHYLAGATHDITERKNVEDDLRESHENFKTLFDNTPDATLVADASTGIVVNANAAAEYLFGAPQESLIGMHHTQLYPHDQRDRANEEFNKGVEWEFSDTPSAPVELVIETPSGVNKSVELVANTLNTDNKLHLLGTFRDIRGRKKNEQELARYHRLLESAQELANIGSWEWNIVDDSWAFSEQWKKIHGLFGANVDTSKLLKIAHPEDAPAIEKAFSEAEEHGAPYDIQHRIIRDDTKEIRYIHALGTVEYDQDSKSPLRMIGTAQDITVQKQAEEQIHRQLAEKETLLREVHHRIKNNMAQIESLLSIQADSAESTEIKSALNTAMSRVQSTRILYEKLLVAKDQDAVSMKEYLESLIESLVEVYNDNAGVSIETNIVDFSFSAKKAIPVGIILNELLTNVFKYAFGDRAEGRVGIKLEKNEEQVTLTVQDNGVGFDERVAANKSTGFGLTLTKMLAEQLDGTFTMESDNGTKSVVTFEV